MVKIFTARSNYRGPVRLDITVKGKNPVGRIFTPTWKMVMGAKEGKYTEMYRDLMRQS